MDNSNNSSNITGNNFKIITCNIINYIKSHFDFIWVITVLLVVFKSVFVFFDIVFYDFESRHLIKKLDVSIYNYVYISFVALIFSIAFLLKKNTKYWYLVLVNFFITFLFVVDILHYRGFGNFFSVHAIFESSNLNNLDDSIFSFIKPLDFILLLDLPVLIFYGIKYKDRVGKIKNSRSNFFVLVILCCTYLYWCNANYSIFSMSWNPKETLSRLSSIGYHYYDLLAYIQDNNQTLTNNDKIKIEKWFEKNNEKLPDNQYAGFFKGKNLLVIQVESMENLIINRKINDQEITPNLNRILKNSWYFSKIHEQNNLGASSDSDLIVNTSVYPIRRGSAFYRFPGNTYNSLPILFQDKGYSTLAIHPDRGSFWNWMPALSSIGFQKCIDEASFKLDEKILLGISDKSYLRQSVPLLEKQNQPFYTFMVTLSSHAPFNLPKEFRELNLPKELDESRLGGYFQSFRYTDKYIGEFLDNLDKKGILDNTVVVIIGDHQGVTKYYKNETNKLKTKEDWWIPKDKTIPFIIYSKGLEAKEFDLYGGQVDILPTISYMMGLDMKKIEKTAMGRNLLNTNRSFAVLTSKEYLSDKEIDENHKKHAIEGVDVADLIINNNYFKLNGYNGKKVNK